MIDELRSPAAVAECVALVKPFHGAGLDPKLLDKITREMNGDEETLVNPFPDARKINPESAAKGLNVSRETGVDAILAADNLPQLQVERDQDGWDGLVESSPNTARYLEQWNKIANESKTRKLKQRNKLLEEGKPREREAIAACNSRTPEAPDLRWIIPVLVAPTFGVVLAAFAVWLTFLTLRWAWRGFQS